MTKRLASLHGIKTQVKDMLLPDFLAIPEIFCQRNTPQRAKETANRLVTNPSPTHLEVKVALIVHPDGTKTLAKLDGNTRAYCWRHGMAPAPLSVECKTYLDVTPEQAKALYDIIDNEKAAKKSKDRLYSALKGAGLGGGNLADRASMATALQVAHHALVGIDDRVSCNIDLDAVIAEFLPELTVIDRYKFPNNAINQGVIAAMIIGLRLYGERTVDFIDRFARNAGEKNAVSADGVQALREIIGSYRASNRGAGKNGRGSALMQASQALPCIRKFAHGERYQIKMGGSLRASSMSITGILKGKPRYALPVKTAA